MNQPRNPKFRPSVVKFVAPAANDTTDSFSSTYTSSSDDESENEEKARATESKNDLKANYDIKASFNKLDFLNNMAYLKIQGDQNLQRGARAREYKNAIEQRKSISIQSIIARQEELFQNVQAASQRNSLGAKKMSKVMSKSIIKNLDSTKDRELILPKLQKVRDPIIKAQGILNEY
jgi:hypothetical protein